MKNKSAFTTTFCVSLTLVFTILLFAVSTGYSQINVGNDRTLCSGSSLKIAASVSSNIYKIEQPITFAPIAGTGNSVLLTDDEVSSGFKIGFKFAFFGAEYDTFYICSNGFITFTANSNVGVGAQTIPDFALPNNLIAFAWEDLDPGLGGSIDYRVIGDQPNRKQVINFKNIPHYLGGNNVTVQVILYEGTNIIEIHTTAMPSGGAKHTMGIENALGDSAFYIPGRNNAIWSAANEAVRFFPQVTVVWSTSTDPNIFATTQIITVSPVITTTYIGTAVFPDNSTASDSITITVYPSPTAGFIYTINGNTVWLTDQSVDAVLWFYDFGDGHITNKQTAYNYYFIGGIYPVMQVVTNTLLCTDTLIEMVDMTHLGVDDDVRNIFGLNTYPNPFIDQLQIEYSLKKAAQVELEVFNITGELVETLFSGRELAGVQHHIIKSPTAKYGSGLYLLRVTVDGTQFTKLLYKLD
ncbi:MAG: T9SS type A sorting domain-containing protein [Bacteroidetes bacterium]|nr:T9SS type A sorting domain-containing protein [Bacteroidota bacterium]